MRRKLFLLGALLGGAFLAALIAEPVALGLRVWFERDMSAVPLPDRPPPRDQTEANLQDLRDLRLLTSLDRSFSPVAKAQFQHGVDALAARAGSLSSAGFAMGVSRLVALAGNAHTTVDLAQRAGRFGLIPLRFAWFADGLYIVRATTAQADLLGDRVLEIDGRSTEGALAAVRPYLSGTEERARADSPPLLEAPALLQAVWPDVDGVRLRLRVQTGAGQTIVRDIDAAPPAPDRFAGQPIMAIGPTPLGLPDDADWRTVLSGAPRTPLSLRAPEQVAYAAPLEQNGLYVRINANADDANGPLDAQLKAISARVPPGGWRWIALDLRFNHGGDEVETAAFTRALPRLLQTGGDLWILTGNATFSAAIITAARARHFVGNRAHIIGERVGDHDQFWTDGGAPLVLRNAGISIGHAYFEHDWAHGCFSIAKCYPLAFIYGVAAGDLSPEITVGWRFADYAAGRDTVMERVRALATGRPASSLTTRE